VPPQQDVERSGALLTVISKRDPERERERESEAERDNGEERDEGDKEQRIQVTIFYEKNALFC
jgi:hypothetical protein